jgi:type VI secretion system protein VasG
LDETEGNETANIVAGQPAGIYLGPGKVGKRIAAHYQAGFSFDEKLVQAIADRCTEVDTGARNVDHILNKTLLPELSAEFLSRLAEGNPINAVNLTVSGEGKFVYEIS